jgi:hypothetical protein
MKERMQRQTSLLDNLRENPLPDAFEVTLVIRIQQSPEKIEFLAQRIEGLPSVSEVEYGQQWIERFANFFNLFKLAGYGLGAIVFHGYGLYRRQHHPLGTLFPEGRDPYHAPGGSYGQLHQDFPFYLEGLIFRAFQAA